MTPTILIDLSTGECLSRYLCDGPGGANGDPVAYSARWELVQAKTVLVNYAGVPPKSIGEREAGA